MAVIDPTGTRKVVAIGKIDSKWDRKCISTFSVPVVQENVISREPVVQAIAPPSVLRTRGWAYSQQPLLAAAMVTLFVLGLVHTPFRT